MENRVTKNIRKFEYTEPSIVKSKYKDKWYIYYTIQYPNQPSEPRKEYGRNYKMNLTKLTGQAKTEAAEALEILVLKSLSRQEDPKENQSAIDNRNIQEIEATKGVTFVEAIEITKIENGWVNPEGTALLSSTNILSFLNSDFQSYIKEIEKLNDVTKITQEDIIFFIERHYNPNGATYFNIKKDKVLPVAKWSISTCVNKMGYVSYLFSSLVFRRRLAFNPALGNNIKKRLKKIKQPVQEKSTLTTIKKKYEIWTKEELKTFDKVGNTPEHLMHYTVGYTCYLGFVRRSEILRLRLENVNLEKMRFEIQSNLTKGGRKYDTDVILNVKINDRLHQVLKKWIDTKFGNDQNPDYFLFPNNSGFDIPFNYFYYPQSYSKLKAELGIAKLPYGLKHTGVTELFTILTERGIDPMKIIDTIQKMCRHASPGETMKYLAEDLGLHWQTNDDLSW